MSTLYREPPKDKPLDSFRGWSEQDIRSLYEECRANRARADEAENILLIAREWAADCQKNGHKDLAIDTVMDALHR